MASDNFYIENASKHEGQEVTLKGWVYNKRSSGKIKFLVMRDGSGLMQGILFKGECDEAAFAEFDKLTQE
jgi:asparaginyl-tRNA synthetase